MIKIDLQHEAIIVSICIVGIKPPEGDVARELIGYAP